MWNNKRPIKEGRGTKPDTIKPKIKEDTELVDKTNGKIYLGDTIVQKKTVELDLATQLPGMDDVYLDEVTFWIKIGKKLEPTFQVLTDPEIRALEKYLGQIYSNIKIEINYPNIKVTKKEEQKVEEGEAYVKLHEEAFRNIIEAMNIVLQAKQVAYLADMGKK